MQRSHPRTLVLVGGGHAHVQVLRRFAMDPPADLRLMLVVDRPVAVYSGMVPGYVAGDYRKDELEIDVVPLARRARAGVILSRALDLDPVRHELQVEGRPPMRFDLASIDVGSTVRGLELPGVAQHALATRPIGTFVQELDMRVEHLAALGRTPRILVVGGGAAGCELAFTLDARMGGRGIAAELCVVTTDDALLAGASRSVRKRVAREASRRGIETLDRRRVVRVDASGALVEASDATSNAPEPVHVEADLVVWATGSAPVAFPEGNGTSRLTRDAKGTLAIRDTLQTVGFDDIFAVGDCARLVDHPWVPRAGVYAVRQGPVLERNLRARLAGRALEPYRPQRDFLSLLNLGEGRALGAKWGMAAAGKSVLRLKDSIDRRFMERFQVLDAEGRPLPALANLGTMGTDDESEMACGGCAAKLGASPLDAALGALPPPPADDSVLLGLDARDDVAATRDDSGRMTLHNVDVIRAFCDDPFLTGRVAASNALSDLFAKGGRPRHAQAIVGLPELPPRLAEELLFQVLAGVRATLDPLGVSLLGGHTTLGDALSVGLAVTGDGPSEDALLRQAGARPGDALLLTRPLGTGVVLAADMQGRAAGEWVRAAHASMLDPNEVAGRIAQRHGAHAATDVTGFGLAGHLLTLLATDDGPGSGCVARLDRSTIPFLPGAGRLWQDGLRSTAHPANEAAFSPRVSKADAFDEAWLFDPQTAGGLLLAVDPSRVSEIRESFAEAGEPEIHRIGEIASTVTRDDPGDAPTVELDRGRIEIFGAVEESGLES